MHHLPFFTIIHSIPLHSPSTYQSKASFLNTTLPRPLILTAHPLPPLIPFEGVPVAGQREGTMHLPPDKNNNNIPLETSVRITERNNGNNTQEYCYTLPDYSRCKEKYYEIIIAYDSHWKNVIY